MLSDQGEAKVDGWMVEGRCVDTGGGLWDLYRRVDIGNPQRLRRGREGLQGTRTAPRNSRRAGEGDGEGNALQLVAFPNSAIFCATSER